MVNEETKPRNFIRTLLRHIYSPAAVSSEFTLEFTITFARAAPGVQILMRDSVSRLKSVSKRRVIRGTLSRDSMAQFAATTTVFPCYCPVEKFHREAVIFSVVVVTRR